MSAAEPLAQWLGAHAAAAFGGALLTLVAVIVIGWWGLARVERRRGPAPLPPARVLILRTLLGLGIAVGAGFVFSELAEALDVGAQMGHFDTVLASALRLHTSPVVLQAFALVTRLGDVSTLTVLCIAVAGLLLAVSRRRLALIWVLALAGNGVLNRVLKAIFERVRPPHDDGLIAASGWSFPSGHSSGSVVAYGMLAYVAVHFVAPRWQLPALLLAATLAFTVGASRVFLQVHYLSDVLAGFASGLLWLTVCIASSEWLRLRRG